MTAYRNRLNAGHYLVGTVKTGKAEPATKSEPEVEAAADTPEPTASDAGRGPDLDSLNKQELLEFAKSLGISPANNDMTKSELRAGIDAHLA